MAAKKTTKRSAAAAVVAVTAVASTSHLASFSAFYLDTKQPFYALAAAPLCFRVVGPTSVRACGARAEAISDRLAVDFWLLNVTRCVITASDSDNKISLI